jgi:hypothetical protein
MILNRSFEDNCCVANIPQSEIISSLCHGYNIYLLLLSPTAGTSLGKSYDLSIFCDFALRYSDEA